MSLLEIKPLLQQLHDKKGLSLTPSNIHNPDLKQITVDIGGTEILREEIIMLVKTCGLTLIKWESEFTILPLKPKI